jgi:Tfp pilus assembly protein PilN
MIYIKTSVGIELRGEDMLIASLQSNFSRGVFTHFARISGYRLLNPEELRREVNQFFRSHGLSKENIVLGIPRKDIVLRYLDLPAEVADNLKQVVQYQVQSFEPTEEDKFYHDYALLRGNSATKRLRVMLAMIRKATLDEALQLMNTLGIRPASVTGSSMGLANLFLQNRKDLQDKICILGDLGISGLEVLALRQGSLVYSREAPKETDTSWEDLVQREAAEAASAIRLGPEALVESFVLAGECSESAYQEIQTAIPECALMRNCIGLEIPGENKPRIQEAASALGLAYTGMVRRVPVKINLLPADRRIHQSRWAYIPAAILGVIVLTLLCALGFRSTVQNQRLIRTLDAQMDSLKGPIRRVQAYRAQSEEMEKRLKSIEDLLNKKDMNLEILRELTSILPADSFLSTYSYRDGIIQISGMSASATDLIPKLEQSPFLKDVVMKGMVYRNPQTNKEQFSFEAKLER